MARTAIAVQQLPRRRHAWLRRLEFLGIGRLFLPYLNALVNSVVLGVRTAVAIQDISALPPFTAGVTLVNSDVANGNMFPNDGRTVVVFQNSTGGSLIFTVESVADQYGRIGDISNQTVLAGAFAFAGPFPGAAWNRRGTDSGYIYVDTNGTGLKVGCLRLSTF